MNIIRTKRGLVYAGTADVRASPFKVWRLLYFLKWLRCWLYFVNEIQESVFVELSQLSDQVFSSIRINDFVSIFQGK